MIAPKRWSRLWILFAGYRFYRVIKKRRVATVRTTIKEGQVLVVSNKKAS